MVRVRTVLVTISPLLAALVIDVLRPYLALDVIDDLPMRDCLLEQLRALAPDLVLLGLSGLEGDELVLPLLAALPTALFLAIAPNGQHAWLHQMRPRRTELPDFSVAALVEALTDRFDVAPPRG